MKLPATLYLVPRQVRSPSEALQEAIAFARTTIKPENARFRVGSAAFDENSIFHEGDATHVAVVSSVLFWCEPLSAIWHIMDSSYVEMALFDYVLTWK